MSLMYAKIRLAEWGRWSRDDTHLGHPRQSAVLGGATSRGTGYLGLMPPHVEMVDVIVRQMEIEPRRVLIVHYTQSGSGREKASRICYSWGQYCRQLRQGQDHVGIELDYAEGCGLSQPVAYSR